VGDEAALVVSGELGAGLEACGGAAGDRLGGLEEGEGGEAVCLGFGAGVELDDAVADLLGDGVGGGGGG